MALVSYRIEGINADRYNQKGLLGYVMHNSGISVEAENNFLRVKCLIAWSDLIPGLGDVPDEFVLKHERMPAYLVSRVIDDARRNIATEELYYCRALIPGWSILKPRRIRTTISVRPTDLDAAEGVLLEIHSHNTMQAYFSGQDDKDEGGCFRLFAVLGFLQQEVAEIRMRVGIYNHFWDIPAERVLEMPKDLRDPDGT